MIWFIIFIAVSLGLSTALMIRQQKNAREIGIFVTIVLIGFAEWLSIFLERKFNLNDWITAFFEWTGL
ncbi:hypothetical protein SAMN04487970_1004120 [Paenibacillus tianmuensis]|uniref:Uncharacterized protein n=1 Tax=Paenibacillus tianmuensis TaxID=624147 RepID=A0A1G4PWB2_9BACL|nr:hypothetical protein [Paenibacillus tianmuensis]SCW36644.1 hypothetical protein SAMN04487970_1004120 [Paenibacillus tianmuensis]